MHPFAAIESCLPNSTPKRLPVKSIAGLVALVSALILSNDWCFVAAPAVVVAVIAVAIADAILDRTVLPSARGRSAIRVGMTLALAVGAGASIRVSPAWAFDEAFGTLQPKEIRDLRIIRHYEGGPGEHTLILTFAADRQAIAKLTARRAFNTDPEEWRAAGSNWSDIWHTFAAHFPLPFGRRSWERIPPLSKPEVFWWSDFAKQTILFWERESGRAVVLSVRT